MIWKSLLFPYEKSVCSFHSVCMHVYFQRFYSLSQSVCFNFCSLTVHSPPSNQGISLKSCMFSFPTLQSSNKRTVQSLYPSDSIYCSHPLPQLLPALLQLSVLPFQSSKKPDPFHLHSVLLPLSPKFSCSLYDWVLPVLPPVAQMLQSEKPSQIIVITLQNAFFVALADLILCSGMCMLSVFSHQSSPLECI